MPPVYLKLSECENTVSKGGVGIVPTDTLYGIVGKASAQDVVERIYTLKGRDGEKPFIILIASLSDLLLFDIHVGQEIADKLQAYWPGPFSIILPCHSKEVSYLHRGTQTLAFRLPHNDPLLSLLKATGPLVAPSANPQGKPPANDHASAKAYFGTSVDFYVDQGTCTAKPSSLLTLTEDGTFLKLR